MLEKTKFVIAKALAKSRLMKENYPLLGETKLMLEGWNTGVCVERDYGRFVFADRWSAVQFKEDYEPKVKNEVNSFRGLFVNVGANIGKYTIMAALNGCKVIALEALPRTFHFLTINIELNRVQNRVVTYNLAGWDRDETLRMKVNDWDSGVSKIANEGIEVHGVQVDELLGEQKPGMILIDAENADSSVLKGMKRALAVHPKVIFEALDMGYLEKCQNVLRESGYSAFRQLDERNWMA